MFHFLRSCHIALHRRCIILHCILISSHPHQYLYFLSSWFLFKCFDYSHYSRLLFGKRKLVRSEMACSAGHHRSTWVHSVQLSWTNEWKALQVTAPSYSLGPCPRSPSLGPEVWDNAPTDGIWNWHKEVHLQRGDPGNSQDHKYLRALIQGPPEPSFCNFFSHLGISKTCCFRIGEAY